MDGVENQPTYPLARVRDLARVGRLFPSRRAIYDMLGLGFDLVDAQECLAALCLEDFDKTDESTETPGQMMDVYRLRFRGKKVYVKVRITPQAEVRIISFHTGEKQ